ncbi:hypothetical protein BGX30_010087 [Mortierella sp. GBA39]|nr:hypothetical protein BGX30_010087 [Mortierella sp. GBA39]
MSHSPFGLLLNGLTQKKAMALSKLKAARTYSYISPQSKETASKLWTKVKKLNSKLLKATVALKLLT